jgi:hypothetical protein
MEEATLRLRQEGVGWVVPHKLVHRVDKETTDNAISNGLSANPFAESSPTYQRKPYEGYAGGGMFVVDRSDYEAVGGIPMVFQGWGAEDECLALILDTLLEGQVRLDHDLWHLWHPTARSRDAKQNRVNRILLRIFMCHVNDTEAMWELARHAAEGGDPRTFIGSSRSLANSVMMIAVETHKRGKGIIKKGEYFRVTTEEARRYKARNRKIARPVNGSLLSTGVRLRTGGY